jgi:hypothetical protein
VLQVLQTENVAQHFFWIALPVILTIGASHWIAFLANRKRGLYPGILKFGNARPLAINPLCKVIPEAVPESDVRDAQPLEPTRYPSAELMHEDVMESVVGPRIHKFPETMDKFSEFREGPLGSAPLFSALAPFSDVRSSGWVETDAEEKKRQSKQRPREVCMLSR